MASTKTAKELGKPPSTSDATPQIEAMYLPKAIVAIDPGTTTSGIVVIEGSLDEWKITQIHADMPNSEVVDKLFERCYHFFVCEKIACMGMAVGETTLETVYWTGRFAEALNRKLSRELHRITRSEIKLHLCHSARAKDANVNQRLLDIWGPKGTKKNPGPTYGMSSHAWSALAVATTFRDLYVEASKT